VSDVADLEEGRVKCEEVIRKIFEDAAFEVMDENLDQTARAQLIACAARRANEARSTYLEWRETQISARQWAKYKEKKDVDPHQV
jgi:hypothetical protein